MKRYSLAGHHLPDDYEAYEPEPQQEEDPQQKFRKKDKEKDREYNIRKKEYRKPGKVKKTMPNGSRIKGKNGQIFEKVGEGEWRLVGDRPYEDADGIDFVESLAANNVVGDHVLLDKERRKDPEPPKTPWDPAVYRRHNPANIRKYKDYTLRGDPYCTAGKCVAQGKFDEPKEQPDGSFSKPKANGHAGIALFPSRYDDIDSNYHDYINKIRRGRDTPENRNSWYRAGVGSYTGYNTLKDSLSSSARRVAGTEDPADSQAVRGHRRKLDAYLQAAGFPANSLKEVERDDTLSPENYNYISAAQFKSRMANQIKNKGTADSTPWRRYENLEEARKGARYDPIARTALEAAEQVIERIRKQMTGEK